MVKVMIQKGTRSSITPLILFCFVISIEKSTGAKQVFPARKDSVADLNKLFTDRQAALLKLVKLLAIQYRDGRIAFDKLAQAEKDLIVATVELPSSIEVRVAALEAVQNIAEENMKIAKLRSDIGARGSEIDLPQATAILQEVRIEILRKKAILPMPLDHATEIKALHKERHASLSKLAAFVAQAYRLGKAEIRQVIRAETDQLGAALELVQSPDEKLIVLNKMRGLAEETSKFAKAKFDLGAKDSEVELPLAMANLLRLRIEILRTKSTMPMARNHSVEIKALQKDQQATLSRLAAVLANQYRAGRLSLGSTGWVERYLHEATLELAESPDTRRAALARFREHAEGFERHAKSLYDVGIKGSEAEYLQGQVLMIEANIALTRMGSKSP